MTSRGNNRAAPPPAAAELLNHARRGLREARAGTANERFATAHLAALRTAAAVLAVRGRPEATSGRRRIRSAWEVLPEVAPELSSWAALFASKSMQRARAEAGVSDAASPQEVQELVRDVGMFIRLVERILLLPTRENLAA
ncbi:SAV_6107 family HEPN domain-containing protein [Streptomyces sp. NPDC047853]|uniref:SAV_6107 family HEPN domain-containing protein n=1 Tax=Streptomyces sp. NPDC047853 TaxID=3365489 RepID=UPI00371DA007